MNEEINMNNEFIEAETVLSNKFLDRLLIKFLLEEPFFADIIRALRKEQTNSIPTAGVAFDNSSIILYWNPEFIKKLPIKQIFGLFKHECYHLIFRHITSRKQTPHLMWNIATDLAINSIIPYKELPEGGFVPGYPLKVSENMPDEIKQQQEQLSNFIQSLPPEKSSEWYMSKLMENKEMQDIIENLMGNSSCQSVGELKDENGNPIPGSGVGFDYHFDLDSMPEGQKELIDAKINDIIKESVERADRQNSWGSCSSAVSQRIRATLYKNVDWKDVLRYFCGTKQKANKTRTHKRINRKYPYIHPGTKVGHTSNIAIYIDQSGSVSDGDLVLFFSALNYLANKTTFTVFHFDTEVDDKSRFEWKKNKKVTKPYRTRSGGTSFDCVEDYHRKIQSEFDGYIILTDGCAPKPKICKSKRCWLLLPNTRLVFNSDKNDTVITMDRNSK